MKKITAVLTIRVTYDGASDPEQSHAEIQLMYAADQLASQGLLSGDDPCLLVDDWNAKVTFID